MKWTLLLASLMTATLTIYAQTIDYASFPVYTGKDLGLTYSSKQSAFKIWAPGAEAVELRFYQAGNGGEVIASYPMGKSANGTWAYVVLGDQQRKFYVFRVKTNGTWSDEILDPYAKIVGLNGRRAMIADLRETNPDGWDKDRSQLPAFPTDAIIYELHVRDASIAANSGITRKGKFVGLAEKGTVNGEGLSTGLDHLKEMGVTHIHLLPFFDYNSVDEANPDQRYNWGYDPLNYNALEGSYSTDPADGLNRIREFKQMVKTFHDNGLNVVMDVVYNHTALTERSYFNQMVPGYYYRQTKDGKFSDATACGNETASERAMVRKFIIESMKYWVEEYHIDGFRIDLMGVHDIVTMNLLSKELHRIKPGILLYGEGWTAGASPLPDSLRALKKNAAGLDRIAVFSDDVRDGIKGSVFEHHDRGFASGKPGMEESVKFGIVASCNHPQVDYTRINYSKAPYSAQPSQTVTYAECHDNHVLWDKLALSATDATEEQRREMHKLALSIVLTSQGISFLHAGTEFLRSKKGVENSFESPDSINAIDWELKSKNKDVVAYVKALISLRKSHPAFRMRTASQIASNINFLPASPGVIAYEINGAAVKDKWKKIRVYFNGTKEEQKMDIPGKLWKEAIHDNRTGNDGNVHATITLQPYSCTVLYQ